MSNYNTRAARREAEFKRNQEKQNYIDQFLAMAHNSVKFENLDDDTPKRYMLKTLFKNGQIAYDKETGLWLRAIGKGIDVYGMPKSWQLFGANGFTVERKPDQVVVCRLNDLSAPLLPFLERQADKLVDIDSALAQNLDAIRTMTIAEVADETQLLSLVNEYEARRVGATVVYKNRNAAMPGDSSIKVQSTGAQYLVDRLAEYRNQVFNETLARIGTISANTDKRERVQGLEVMSAQGFAIDSLYIIVDTFNYDAEVGGLDIRLTPNTSLQEIVDNTQTNTGAAELNGIKENIEKHGGNNYELQFQHI